MSELPRGWIETTIGDVTDYVSRGKSPKYADKSSLPIVNQRAIRWVGIQNEHLKFVHPDQFPQWTEERFIREGDVLWNSTGTGTIGRACLVKKEDLSPPKVVDSHVTIVRPRRDAIEARYLFAWIRGPELQRSIEDLATGTTNQIELSRGTVIGTRVPLAPLAEQRRIVDKLDALLARLDACQQRLDRVPALLRRFRQSVLTAATSGELTREWREARGATGGPEDWTTRPLADLCMSSRVITYGVIKLGNETPGGVPCLRTSNVRWLKIESEGVKRIAPALSAEFGRTVLQGGEVLVNVRGTLGGVAVTDTTMRGWNVSREVAVVPVDPARIEPHFLAFWIGADASQRWLSKVEKGVAYTGINIEDLRTLPVSCPGLGEQAEVVRRVQTLFDFADDLERRYKSISRPISVLSAALLAKAFRGELVPQDPNDQPAAVSAAPVERRPAPSGGRPKRTKSPARATTKELDSTMRKLVDVLAETRDWMPAQQAFRSCGIEDGSDTEAVEGVYAELRELVRSKRVAVEAVRDSGGRKLHDRLRLIQTI
ncbi:MAG TPA: restriction endonuclease subunit S [Polyangia bacterium]|nr:restriction endonuclease subunit S [Polyangia bacterium]